ncbi:MAG: chloride channel protein [Coriobacteriia bacterium]
MFKRTHRLVQWVALGALVGVAAGVASAAFLWLLGLATAFREGHEIIIWGLPLAGALLGLVLQKWGGPVRGGNNLVIDTVHEDSARIPLSVAPAILGGTVLTHLFGGSVGREGAAVQMGAALADEISFRLCVRRETRTQLLAAGIAGGFGAVFGTPVAGAVFGLEVVQLGKVEYTALVPALVASVVGDMTVRALGIKHTIFPVIPSVTIDVPLLLRWILVGVIVAAAAVVFVELTHRLRDTLEVRIPPLWLRMFFGGAAVVAAWQLLGTSDYLGLGIPFITQSFVEPAPYYAFALKLLFTAVALGCGFLGGEVTPLFFIGATLGSTLAGPLGLPLSLTAGVCMAAMFAAASNTPIALSIMAVELFGVGVFPHVAVVSVVAYLMTGHRSIYPSQRLVREKWGSRLLTRPVSLRDFGKQECPVDYVETGEGERLNSSSQMDEPSRDE